MEPLKQGSYTRTGGAPQADNAVVMFHMEAVQDPAATARAGRPICVEKEMIEIRLPGNPYHVWDIPVTDEYREKYGRAYEAFKRGEDIASEGTPIESLTVLNRAQIKELKYLDIFTVEAAAGMSDQACQRFMGGNKLRDLAKNYLAQAADLAPMAAMTDENDKLKSEIAAQGVQIEELNRMMIGMKAQLDVYAQAPKVPEYVAPGSFGGQAPSVAFNQPAQQVAPASSLDTIGQPGPRRPGRPRKDA